MFLLPFLFVLSSALAAQQNMRIETLNRIRRTLVTDRPRNIEDCIVWARWEIYTFVMNY